MYTLSKTRTNKTAIVFCLILFALSIGFLSGSAWAEPDVLASIQTYFDPDESDKKIQSGNVIVKFNEEGIKLYFDDELLGQVDIEEEGKTVIIVYKDHSFRVETDGGTSVHITQESSESYSPPVAPVAPATPAAPADVEIFDIPENISDIVDVQIDRTSDQDDIEVQIEIDSDEISRRVEEAMRRVEKLKRSGNSGRQGDIVRIAGNVNIEEDDFVEGSITVIGGSITVDGFVDGDVFCTGGSIAINGNVDHDVVCVGGSIALGPDAYIGNDVLTMGGSVHQEEGCYIEGNIIDMDTGKFLKPSAIFERDKNKDTENGHEWKESENSGSHDQDYGPDISYHYEHKDTFLDRLFRLFAGVIWTLFTIAVVILTLVFIPTQIDRAGTVVKYEGWKAFFVGVLAWIALPIALILSIFLLVICIGALLVPGVILFYVILAIIGYSVGSLQVGRYLNNQLNLGMNTPMKAALVGVVAFEILPLIGLFISLPGSFTKVFGILLIILGAAIKLVAVTTGMGALLLSKGGKETSPYASSIDPLPMPPEDEEELLNYDPFTDENEIVPYAGPDLLNSEESPIPETIQDSEPNPKSDKDDNPEKNP
ncbi:MAG: hypothetical protein B6244_07490 [Candidatus Cloacimonetes bacterium 4572_55]|nr:MAG: hypothetical protein B6244_07490 [Candidatus Cloacimonetes bacterium 4572_55]